MNAPREETPLPRDTAILVAAPMDEPLGDPSRRPVLAERLRDLTAACAAVARTRTIDRTDRVTWETPKGAHPSWAISLTTYRPTTGMGGMRVDVRVLRGPAEPTRRSLRGEAVQEDLGLEIELRTRIPGTDDLRDHVPDDALDLLAAFARAAASALDGTSELLSTIRWEDASDAIVGDAWFRHLADAGRPAELSRITNAPAHPLGRHTTSGVIGSGPIAFPAPAMPPAMEIHVGHDGEIRFETLHRNAIVRDAPDPMAVLRATALLGVTAASSETRS